jgi:hypothetical protein
MTDAATTGPSTAHCCDDMRRNLDFHCEQHESPFDCPDALVYYSDKFDEYGIIVHDGGPSVVTINHCPWCGTKLPESQRDRYFAELEAQGYDITKRDSLPEKYHSAAWRKPH